MICQVYGDGTVEPDPNTINKGNMWWWDWNDINAMIAVCAANLACTKGCSFQVVNYDAFDGLYYNSGENYNGKPLFVNAENSHQVFQCNEGDGWDLCKRDGNTGPSTCGGANGRSGFTGDVNAPMPLLGPLFTWGVDLDAVCLLHGGELRRSRSRSRGTTEPPSEPPKGRHSEHTSRLS
eukprot:g19459.t1